MDGQIVRVLFGHPTAELRREVIESLSVPWYAKNVHYYAAGQANAKLLRNYGARHVTLVSQDPHICLEYGCWYPKPRLLWQAVKDHGEVLYLDFDCHEWRRPDSRMWDLVREGSDFQSMRIEYSTPRVADLEDERARLGVSRQLCFSACAVYCREVRWIWRWLRAYKTLAKRRLAFLGGDDETSLMFAIEAHYGVVEAVRKLDEWECQVVLMTRRRCPPKWRDRVYFVHKKTKEEIGSIRSSCWISG